MGRPTRVDAHSSSMRTTRWGWEAGGGIAMAGDPKAEAMYVVISELCRFFWPVIGHGNEIRYSYEFISYEFISRLWRVSPRQDAGVSEDRPVCHHPISQPFTTSDGSKIQVRLRHVLPEDPTISYVEYLTNLKR